MASPRLFDPAGCSEAGVVIAHTEFLTTTNGTLATPTTRSRLVSSIVRNSAGRYTITLSQGFNALMGLTGNIVEAVHTAGRAVSSPFLVSRSTTANPATFVIQFLNISEAAADVSDGASVMLTLWLKNSGF